MGDPKTKQEFPELVTQQFSYQQIFYWNHTANWDPEDPHTPNELHWEKMKHQCYYTDNWGVRVIFDCAEQDEAYYVPVKRFGHSLITLGDQKSMILYGGYSTICADYRNDLWHYNMDTRIW